MRNAFYSSIWRFIYLIAKTFAERQPLPVDLEFKKGTCSKIFSYF